MHADQLATVHHLPPPAARPQRLTPATYVAIGAAAAVLTVLVLAFMPLT